MRPFVLILAFVFSSPSFASHPHALSAKRMEGETWVQAYQRLADPFRFQAEDGSAVKMAVPYGQLDLSKATVFAGSEKSFMRTFKKMRDLRFLPDPDVMGMQRRLSWLYPDDGCHIRAEWLAKRFNGPFGSSAVNKIFAFGDLDAKTKNHPEGHVRWWFHVVAGWKWKGNVFVFDPAIDPLKPMALSAWVAAIAPDPEKVKVAICQSGTFEPSDRCAQSESLIKDEEAVEEAQTYLREERARLKVLNRSMEELGDSPPWNQ